MPDGCLSTLLVKKSFAHILYEPHCLHRAGVLWIAEGSGSACSRETVLPGEDGARSRAGRAGRRTPGRAPRAAGSTPSAALQAAQPSPAGACAAPGVRAARSWLEEVVLSFR